MMTEKMQAINVRNEGGGITIDPTDSKNEKRILWTILYTWLWQLRWNDQFPPKTQTTTTH